MQMKTEVAFSKSGDRTSLLLLRLFHFARGGWVVWPATLENLPCYFEHFHLKWLHTSAYKDQFSKAKVGRNGEPLHHPIASQRHASDAYWQILSSQHIRALLLSEPLPPPLARYVWNRVWRIYSNIRIFEYSNILVTNIYSNIRSYQFFFYKYIQTFICVKSVCTNIFRHSFVSMLECKN